MARPVQYNITGEKDLKLVREGPEGLGGEGFFATKLDQVVGKVKETAEKAVDKMKQTAERAVDKVKDA